MAHADVAWGGGDSFSMPIGFIYGDAIYIDDVLFDKRDKSVTRPRVVGKMLKNRVKKANFEANNGGDEYADAVEAELRKENYSMHITSRKAPTNMSKMTRIEQHQDSIRRMYFRAPGHRDDEYDRFMAELTTTSLTSKNLHDDAADSLAGLCDVIYNGMNYMKITKRPF